MPVSRAKPRRAGDSPVFLAIALALGAMVFAGFSRTYYLKAWYGAPPLTTLLHLHGIAMTVWYALFIVQTQLVAAHRVALHRRIGVAGVGLAALVAALGGAVSVTLARQRLLAQPQSVGGPMLLAIQLFAILLVFCAFVALGVLTRRRPDRHKRYMTLAMLSTLGPAVTRLPLGSRSHDVAVATALTIGIIVICVAADTLRNRRLHPVSGWGAATIIAAIFASAAFGQTALWGNIVRRVLL